MRELSGIRDYRKRSLEFESLGWFSQEDDRLQTVVTGDSHSKDLYNTLNASQRAGESLQIARYSIRPEGLADPDDAFYATPNFNEAKVVMIAPRYSEFDLQFIGPAIDVLKSHEKTVVLVLNTPEFSGGLKTNIADSIILPRLQRGQFPEPKALADMINAAFTDDFHEHRRKWGLNEALSEIGRKHGAIILARSAYICPEDCIGIDEELTKYIYDYGHVSLEGAAFYGSVMDAIGWLDPVLDSF